MTVWKRSRICRSLGVLSAVAVVSAQGVGRAEESGPPQMPPAEHFTIDPVLDGLIVGGGASFSFLLGLVISSGELRPLPPGDPKNLLALDRIAVTQTIDPNANFKSNLGLWTAIGFSIVDPILSGVRDGRRAFLVDAIMYAESYAIITAFTSATKIGVRRPRPVDYALCGTDPNTPECQSTNLQLSFFSGHTSVTAAISGTASYLAFMRGGIRSARAWITLSAGTLLTAFVAYERVRSGDHFPTDVIMGAMAGGGVGILVPHLHRRPHYHEREYCAPPVWIGYAPVPGGGAATVTGRF